MSGAVEATLRALREAVEAIRTRVRPEAPAAGSGPEIDVEALMRRPPRTQAAEAATASQAQLLALPRALNGVPPIVAKDRYELGELLAYQDVDFVENAYRAILRRAPDMAGLSHHLELLHSGRASKVELLAAMRASAEGKGQRVKVRGLRMASMARSMGRFPLLGPIAEMFLYFTRVPTIVRNLERQEVQLFRRERELRAVVDASASLLERSLADVASRQDQDRQAARAAGERQSRRLSGLAAEVTELRDAVQANPGMAELARLAESVLATSAALDAARQAAQERLDAAQGRLDALDARKADANEVRAAVERLDAVKANEQAVTTLFADMFTRERIEALLAEGRGGLDAFYVAFEDRFRGSREEIKRSMGVFLPAVRAAGAGDALSPVLDIGCGRGEWLEVLKEAGLVARGIDLNGDMARQSRGRGLDVAEGDALEHLRRLPEGSLGAVTAMHVIEHLGFERMIELFDESLRVLRPGGLVIFETPNPENLQVGACNFWYDPTHVRPIPPLAAQFIATERGFARVEIMRLHPYPLDQHPQSGDAELRERLVRVLYGPQDYAVLAWKG